MERLAEQTTSCIASGSCSLSAAHLLETLITRFHGTKALHIYYGFRRKYIVAYLLCDNVVVDVKLGRILAWFASSAADDLSSWFASTARHCFILPRNFALIVMTIIGKCNSPSQLACMEMQVECEAQDLQPSVEADLTDIDSHYTLNDELAARPPQKVIKHAPLGRFNFLL